MSLKSCNDPLMRGVVLAPAWARDVGDFARAEYGAGREGSLLSRVAAMPRSAPPRRGLREVLRGLRPARADPSADPIEV